MFEDLEWHRENYPEEFANFNFKPYHLGISPEILNTYFWLHSDSNGIKVSERNYKEPDGLRANDLYHNVSKLINESIQCLCSGVMYPGLTAEDEDCLLAFVDTSGSTRTINSYNIIAKKCVEMADRFGIDGLFTLSAEHSLVYDSVYEQKPKLHE